MLRKWSRNAGKDARTGETEAIAVTEENAETMIEEIEPTKAIGRVRKTEMIEKIE